MRIFHSSLPLCPLPIVICFWIHVPLISLRVFGVFSNSDFSMRFIFTCSIPGLNAMKLMKNFRFISHWYIHAALFIYISRKTIEIKFIEILIWWRHHYAGAKPDYIFDLFRCPAFSSFDAKHTHSHTNFQNGKMVKYCMRIYKSFISLPISKCIIFLVVKSPQFHKTRTLGQIHQHSQINIVSGYEIAQSITPTANAIEIFSFYNWQFVVLNAMCQLD